MAPVTPSPHRFISERRRQASPAKSSLSVVRPLQQPPAPAEEHDPGQERAPVAPSQFATTPRFTHGRSRSSAYDTRPGSPQKPALIDALRTTGRQYEDVEDAPLDAANDDGDDEMLDTEQIHAPTTTEDAVDAAQHLDDRTQELPYSPKRRRLDTINSHEPVTTTPHFKRPQLPASGPTRPAPRFVPPMSSAISSTADEPSTQQQQQHRPAFLRPSVAPQEASEPLPEAFSPHRRGQKYVPGGMAATMQQLVIETGQAAAQSRRGQAHLRGEDFVLKVKVDEVMGDGPYLAKARAASGAHCNVLLTQQRAGAGGERAQDVRVGSTIGVRAPTWEIEVCGQRWAVAVDWKMLS